MTNFSKVFKMHSTTVKDWLKYRESYKKKVDYQERVTYRKPYSPIKKNYKNYEALTFSDLVLIQRLWK